MFRIVQAAKLRVGQPQAIIKKRVPVSLVFLAMGLLGITGLLPALQTNPAYVNLGEIILGALGLVVGIYARRSGGEFPIKKGKLSTEKENVQLRKEQYDQLIKENERLKKENERQRYEAAQHSAEQAAKP